MLLNWSEPWFTPTISIWSSDGISVVSICFDSKASRVAWRSSSRISLQWLYHSRDMSTSYVRNLYGVNVLSYLLCHLSLLCYLLFKHNAQDIARLFWTKFVNQFTSRGGIAGIHTWWRRYSLIRWCILTRIWCICWILYWCYNKRVSKYVSNSPCRDNKLTYTCSGLLSKTCRYSVRFKRSE